MAEVFFSYGGKKVELAFNGGLVTKTFRNNGEPRIPGATTQLDNEVNAYLGCLAKASGESIVEEFQTMDLQRFGCASPMASWIRVRAEQQGYQITFDDGLNIRAQRIHRP
jgi:hypothetical protein